MKKVFGAKKKSKKTKKKGKKPVKAVKKVKKGSKVKKQKKGKKPTVKKGRKLPYWLSLAYWKKKLFGK